MAPQNSEPRVRVPDKAVDSRSWHCIGCGGLHAVRCGGHQEHVAVRRVLGKEKAELGQRSAYKLRVEVCATPQCYVAIGRDLEQGAHARLPIATRA